MVVSPGQATSNLRQKWGMNNILNDENEKTREALSTVTAARNLGVPTVQVSTTIDLEGFRWGDIYPFTATDSNDCTPGVQIEEGGQPFVVCNVRDRWTRREGQFSQVRETIALTSETLFEAYPLLERMSDGNNWQLLLDLGDEVAIVKPTTMFWVDGNGDRSTRFNLTAEGVAPAQSLYLEFLLVADHDAAMQSLTLMLRESPDKLLVSNIDRRLIRRLISDIDQWLSRYTGDDEPFLINTAGILMVADDGTLGLPSSAATSIHQLRLIIACLESYRVTQISGLRERAFNMAHALIDYFYLSVS